MNTWYDQTTVLHTQDSLICSILCCLLHTCVLLLCPQASIAKILPQNVSFISPHHQLFLDSHCRRLPEDMESNTMANIQGSLQSCS